MRKLRSRHPPVVSSEQSLFGQVLAVLWLAGLLLLSSSATAGFVPVEVDPQDPATLSARLRTPLGLYSGIVALTRSNAETRKGLPSEHICTGVFIKPGWVLTEAYCIPELEHLQVLAGDPDLKKAQSFSVTRVIKHEAFSGVEHSIALLQVEGSIPDKPALIARELPKAKARAESGFGSAVVAGWGIFFENEPLDRLNHQRHLTVQLVASEECNQPQVYGGKIRPGMICAASAFKGIDACSGFGGAPLMTANARGRFVVLGTVSWSEDCARSHKPTVYTNLSAYVPWIESKIGPLPTDAVRPVDPQSDSSAAPSTARNAKSNANVAPEGAFRYMVSIGQPDPRNPTLLNQLLIHACGGVLMNRRWVLTAAHCVADKRDNPGELRLKVDSETLSRRGVYLKAVSVIVHPRYRVKDAAQSRFSVPENDLALIQIDGDIPADIVPPPLADSVWEREILGQSGQGPRAVLVLGWGKNALSRLSKHKNDLHMMAIHIVDRGSCNEPASYGGLITDELYCAGSEDADTCEGDSGGPLLGFDSQHDMVLIGIVSWGDGCGKNNKPGVYVRLPSHYDWILENIRR